MRLRNTIWVRRTIWAKGVAKDNREGMHWYRMAAEQGLAIAQFALGGAYYFGRGVAKDHGEGVRWTRMAAEQGHAKAQVALGLGIQ